VIKKKTTPEKKNNDKNNTNNNNQLKTADILKPPPCFKGRLNVSTELFLHTVMIFGPNFSNKLHI